MASIFSFLYSHSCVLIPMFLFLCSRSHVLVLIPIFSFPCSHSCIECACSHSSHVLVLILLMFSFLCSHCIPIFSFLRSNSSPNRSVQSHNSSSIPTIPSLSADSTPIPSPHSSQQSVGYFNGRNKRTSPRLSSTSSDTLRVNIFCCCHYCCYFNCYAFLVIVISELIQLYQGSGT